METSVEMKAIDRKVLSRYLRKRVHASRTWVLGFVKQAFGHGKQDV